MTEQSVETVDTPIHTIAPNEVYIRSNRQRQYFDQKKMDELVESIREIGQTQPGICYINSDNRLELIVGERRLRACTLAQVPFSYYLKGDEVQDKWLREKIELDENLHREDLTWQEEDKAVARLHELFIEKYGEARPGRRGGQKTEDTAAYLGVSRAKTEESLKLAEAMKFLPEVAEAKNRSEAKKVLKKLIDKATRADALDRAQESSQDFAKGLASAFIPEAALEQAEKAEKVAKDDTRTVYEKKLAEYSHRVIQGKFSDTLSKFNDGFFQVVLFDPPWGVSFGENKKDNPAQDDYKDSPEEFFEKLVRRLSLLHTKMAPDSHLYMFFGIVHHGFVYDSLEAAGFTTNRMPIIWHKRGAHTTRNPQVWPGRCYEPIAYARKGSKPLARPGLPDIIETKPPTPLMKHNHPSAKHPEVYRQLLVRSCSPGDHICDPMCGSGAALVAADSLSQSLALDFWGIEKDESYRNLSIFNLAKGYTAVVDEIPENTAPVRADYTPPAVADDYKQLKPGSEEWKAFWNAHPEQQEEMLAWRAQNK